MGNFAENLDLGKRVLLSPLKITKKRAFEWEVEFLYKQGIFLCVRIVFRN